MDSQSVESVSKKNGKKSVKFNIEHLLNSLQSCVQEDGSICMDSYILAYEELFRFFESLGTVFSFVASDVESKISILKGHRASEVAEHYKTLQSMVNYEKAQDIMEPDDYSSGSRTLLRLHRALEFTIEFLRGVEAADNDAKTSSHAQAAYKNTLAKYHPWLVQKGALFAMYALPTRQNLVKNMCTQNLEEAQLLLPKVVESAKRVYSATQQLYEEHDILNLK